MPSDCSSDLRKPSDDCAQNGGAAQPALSGKHEVQERRLWTAAAIGHQLPNDLPTVSMVMTGHDEAGLSHVLTTEPPMTAWHDSVDNGQMAFYSLYHTVGSPANTEQDYNLHARLMHDSPSGPPLVVTDGTVARMVDFAPGYTTVLHRSLSIDYGVVIEGSVDLVLDSGEVRNIERGGTIVQRGTMHAWRNPHPTNWARVFFVLVSALPRQYGGGHLEEDLGGL
ncbi:hypothetical protein F66182_4156 [Fusarium sp. NRRL 66182]|nr:hypothetical protein F66182_4156 [Fusarium sp. NRRL 66182]